MAETFPPRYPRDMRGYGRNVPNANWPNRAKIAVNFVVNYEEGGENNILHGDAASEAFLSEIVGAAQWPGQRHWNMETIYEYGARAGFWRLWRLFNSRHIKPTVYGVSTALMRAPDQVAAMQESDWEIASHGLKWIEYKDFSRDEEKQHFEEAIRLHAMATGERPKGWYTGRTSMRTVDIAAEMGGFAYVADSYADDLPFWQETTHGPQLIVPYTLDANDMRFATPQGFNSGEQFFNYLKDSFDVLYEEGKAGTPKMMSIGLHCRLVGRPGRFAALRKFVDYAHEHADVWFPTRLEIAEHWAKEHPYVPYNRPSEMENDAFMSAYGGIFEHSPWVAERTFSEELGPHHDTAQGLHFAMRNMFRAGSEEERLGVLKAHPDLAGKLAQADRLTAESKSEQASAGLDKLTGEEFRTFSELNQRYTEKFGFPFIIAVKGLTKQEILTSFQSRVENSQSQEFQSACEQVEKIALLRLSDILPS